MENRTEKFAKFVKFVLAPKEQIKILGGETSSPQLPPLIEYDEHGNPVPSKGNGGG